MEFFKSFGKFSIGGGNLRVAGNGNLNEKNESADIRKSVEFADASPKRRLLAYTAALVSAFVFINKIFKRKN